MNRAQPAVRNNRRTARLNKASKMPANAAKAARSSGR
jgi:hypothetical protein